MTRPRLLQNWPMLVSGLSVLLLFLPVILEAAHLWLTDEYNTHGIFIPFMAGALVWWKRGEIAGLSQDSAPEGWAFLLLGLGLEMIAWHAQIRMFAMLSLVPILLGMTLLFAGKKITGVLRFPILFLLFMAPLPRDLVLPVSFPVQVISTRAACWGAQQLGVPLIMQGFNVALPKATVEVQESCSGFKYVLTLVVFSSFYASLFAIPFWRQAVLVVFSVPVAIFCNVVRVMVLIMLGAWGSESLVHRFHDASGIFVLGLCFAMLAGSGRLLGCKRMRYEV